MAKNRKKATNPVVSFFIVLTLLLVIASGVVLWMCIRLVTQPNQPLLRATEPTQQTELPAETEPEETTEPPTTLPPEPEHVVSTATIGATGDILMHLPVIQSAKHDGVYEFDDIFQYLLPYATSVDYAVANLETTLAGTSKPYSGYPQFNCPDEIVDAVQTAGFDMLLTANNHCFDTGLSGYQRTIQVIREKGMANLGTMADPEEPKYAVQDINGIRVGMLCYTYETPTPQNGYAGRVYLNGIAMSKGGEEIITSFLPSRPDPFYAEVESFIAQMREEGAEAIVMFIHWGEEYVLKTIPYQVTMAQKLCDLGVDVIVGGHPHVVEPIELLTSTTDPEHKTVCLYSMGNAVSNQRLGNLSSVKTAHTEDGVWFTFTFSKYSDDTVYLENVDLIPCWVDLRNQPRRQYDIIPLDASRTEEWQEAFGLSDSGLNAAKRSYDRTMAIVGEGLTASQTYLAEQKDAREAAYLAAVGQ